MIRAVPGQIGILAQQLGGHEPQGQPRKAGRSQRDRARVTSGGEPRRQHTRQGVTAVVADEDRARTRPRSQGPLEVRQPLVEVEQIVRDPLTEQHRNVQLPPLRHMPGRTVLSEEGIQVPPSLPRRPSPSRDQYDERRRDRRWKVRTATRIQQGQPHRPRRLVRSQAALQIPPGHLGRQRVEPGPALVPQLGERAGELEPTAVRSADRADQRITRPLASHPVQAGDEVDEFDHVAALEVGVHHVCDAGALAETALVEAQHAEARVEPGLEGGRVLGPAAGPAVAVHDQRDRVRRGRAGGLEERVTDPHRSRRPRFRHRGHTAGRDRGGRG